MPITVPRLPSESPEALPGVRVDPSTPRAAFGGGAGNVAASIDTGGVSQVAEQIAQHEKRKADTIAYTNASAQLSNIETNLRVKAHSATGANAFTLPEETQTAWQEQTGAIAKTMTNATQREAFQGAVTSHWSSLNESVQMHVADQRKVYAGQVYDGYLAAESNAAIAAYTDPDRVQLSIDRRAGAIADHAEAMGIAPEARDKVIAQMKSDTHTDVITRMLNATPDGESPTMAADYYRAHQSDIIGNDAIKLGGLIGKKTVEGIAQQQGDAIYDKALNLDDALKQARDIQEPTVRTKVEERLRRAFEDHAKSVYEEQRKTIIELNDQLHANGGDFDALPIEKRDKLTPNEEESMRRNADQIRFPKQHTNLSTKASLLNMAGLHPDAFKSLDLTQYRDQFSPQDYSTILNKQLSMRTSETRAAESDAKRKERQDEATAKKNAALIQHRANLLNAIKDPVQRKNIEKFLPPIDTLPHGITPSPHIVPGGPIQHEPVPGAAPAGLQMTPVKDSISAMRIPQSWKDASADNPEYEAYLEHHGEVA